MAEYGVDTQKLLVAGLLSLILTAAVIVGLQVLYYQYEAGLLTSEKFDQPPAKLEALLADQRPRLTDYRVVDKEQAVVGVPIDRAMELVVAELSPPKAGDATDAETKPEEDPDER